ncbi:MAG: HEAT repeat domain-containing protein [Anaerolineales bacterium]|jgi:HEAT repeat protein
MLAAQMDQCPQVINELNTFTASPAAIAVQPDRKLDRLLADLSTDTPWGDRRMAARTLGHLRSPQAVPGLLDALPADPLWVVRCAIIQALESIGDPQAIPTLRQIAEGDGFQVVRSYAAKAIERLSKGENSDWV